MSTEAARVSRLVVAAGLGAGEGRLSAVSPHVELQQRLGGRRVVAHAADVAAHLVVQDLLVDPERLHRAEHLGAGRADVRSEPLWHGELVAVCVHHPVVQQLRHLTEALVALCADEASAR